jgi:hypothetical protein
MLGTFVESPENQYLYHYTDLDSAKSIIEKGQFWVSDAFTTNDENEVVHTRDIVKKLFLTHFQQRGEEVERICFSTFDTAVELIRKHAFILCFSLTKNSIPLWKHYARKDGKTGLCMRFDFSTIKPNPIIELMSQKRVFQDANDNDVDVELLVLDHKVTYSESDKQARIKEYLELASDVLEHIDLDNCTAAAYEKELDLLEDIFSDILLFSFISKDSSWKAEEEYRMVFLFPGAVQLDSILKTRKRGDHNIRYVTLNMKSNNTFSLNRIYVNSKKDLKFVKRSIKSFIGEDVKVKET